MIGEKISPILIEIEDSLWEIEALYPGIPHEFTKEGLRAAMKIFVATAYDQIWALQEKEGIPIEHRMEMVAKFAEELKKLVFTFTGIDTLELYKEKFSGSFGSN